jgi:hypothetical protein
MRQPTTNRDTILDEIHQTREWMAEKFGGDIAAILEDARKRQKLRDAPFGKVLDEQGVRRIDCQAAGCVAPTRR